MTVCNIYQVLMEDRSYRRLLSGDEALGIIEGLVKEKKGLLL